MAQSSVLSKQTAGGSNNEESTARELALREEALNALIEERALLDEAEKRGFTADALREDTENRFRKMVGAVAAYVLSSYPDLEGDALTEQVESLLKATGESLDSYYETALKASMLGALDVQLLSEAPLPDENALHAAYEALWHQQKTLFDADENAFEAAMLSGSPVLYRPRVLKQIQKAEFLFDDGALALISQTEAIAPESAQAMRDDQSARANEKAQTAWAALQRGEITFDTLLVQQGSSSAVNYHGEGSTRFAKTYTDIAAAFQTPGTFSNPYPLPNGYAILYYVGELPPCERIPFDQVREQLLRDCVRQSQQEYLRQAKDELVSQAHIEVFEEMGE